MTLAKPSSFDIGRKGFLPSQQVSNLSMCRPQEVDATLDDRCGIWEHLHSFREVKCLQGSSKILWIGIKNIMTLPSNS